MSAQRRERGRELDVGTGRQPTVGAEAHEERHREPTKGSTEKSPAC